MFPVSENGEFPIISQHKQSLLLSYLNSVLINTQPYFENCILSLNQAMITRKTILQMVYAILFPRIPFILGITTLSAPNNTPKINIPSIEFILNPFLRFSFKVMSQSNILSKK